MWDMNSGKSRGYGFLAFRDKTDAEQAIATMNGEWLGSRAIRVNWANQKTQTGSGSPGGGNIPLRSPVVGGAPAPMNFMGGPLSYESVVSQTPAYNTTVYVGNLVPYCTQADLIPLFQSIGYLSEIRMQADRGFAFVKLDTHENAAMAIIQLQGQLVHGRPIKCSWGKDRSSGEGTQPSAAMAPAPSVQGYGTMPMYGIPQPNQYAQFGYGYPGFPGAQASPGQQPSMAQPGGTVGGQGGQNVMASGLAGTAPGSDPSLVGQGQGQGQQQWSAQDQTAYAAYAAQQAQPYWGGYYGGQQADGQHPS